MELQYKWLKRYGWKIEETEDFLYVKKNGCIYDVFTTNTTEKQLFKAVKGLEKRLKKEIELFGVN